MKRLEIYKNHGYRTAVCRLCEHEQSTIQGLAYTPADMARMAERGLPVNNLNNQKVYFDGTPDATYHIGDERKRGIDVADLWESNQRLRTKARNAAAAAKRKKNG